MRVGVIGCGNMGSGIVLQLVNAGFKVVCFDPKREVRHRMLDLGATSASSARDLAEQCPTIVLSLPTADIVHAVVTDIINNLQPNAIVLDTSTSMPATSQALAALGLKHRFSFVDGPVSGGPAAANAGTMTMLLGGDKQSIAQLKPITDVIAGKTVNVGESGAGHAAKIANNLLCAANLVLVSEALRLAASAGVSAENLLEGINAGSGRSGVSELNYPKWILNENFDSGFTMGLMRKDVQLALDLAQSTGTSLNGFPNIANIWLEQSSNIPDTADFNEIANFT